MGTTLVKAQVIDQSLQITSKPKIASGGVDETIIEWAFCELWEGFTKTAIFCMNENAPYYALISDDNLCTIPHEAVATDGVLNFGVFGADPDGVVRTSEIARYKIVKGAITEGLQPSDPTPEFWEQMLSRIEELYQREVAFENANRLEIDPDSGNWIQGGKDTGMLARATQIHVKWSAAYPTKNSDIKDTPDAYIGVYVGKETTAPTDYTKYKWYCYKGDAVTEEQVRLLVEAATQPELERIQEAIAGAAVLVSMTTLTAAASEVAITLPDDYAGFRLRAVLKIDGSKNSVIMKTPISFSTVVREVQISREDYYSHGGTGTEIALGDATSPYYNEINILVMRNSDHNIITGTAVTTDGLRGITAYSGAEPLNSLTLMMTSVSTAKLAAGTTIILEGIPNE